MERSVELKKALSSFRLRNRAGKDIDLNILDRGTGFRRKAVFVTLFWLLQIALSGLAQIYIAARYGTGLDTYLAGIAIPNTIFMVLTSGLGISTITYFHEVEAKAGTAEAIRKISSLGLQVFIISIPVSLVLIIFALPFLSWLVPGLPVQGVSEAAHILKITAPSVPFLSLTTMIQGLLQANQRFYTVSVAAIAQTSLVPVFLLFGAPANPDSLAWGFTLASFLSCILLLTAAWQARIINLNSRVDSGMTRLLKITLPLFIMGAFTHLLWLAERNFASSQGAGAISALGYAQRLINLFSGILAYGLSSVLFPLVSQQLENKRPEQAGFINRKVLLWLLLTSFLFGGIIWVSNDWIVKLMFERGAFNQAASALTATAVTMYIGLFFYNIFASVIVRNAMAARENGLIIIGSILLFTSYLLIAPALISRYGFQGVPLATSVTFLLNLCLYLVVMLIRHPSLYLRTRAQE